MDEFCINEGQLDRGLRQFPVGHCYTSSVDPEKGLMYRGIPIRDFIDMSVEDVLIKLLEPLNGSYSFSDFTAADLVIESKIIDAIHNLPKTMKEAPMKVFSMGLLLLGAAYSKKDHKKDLMTLVALLPHLVATVLRFCDPKEDLEARYPTEVSKSFVERFIQFLGNEHVENQELFLKVMSIFIVLHMDHGGGNLSAFVGKATSSGGVDVFSSLAAAMCALEGPKHGGANSKVMDFINEIPQDCFENDDKLKNYIIQCLEEKRPIFGFGHAVLRAEDPRACIFYDLIIQHFPDDPLSRKVLALRAIVPKVLGPVEKISNPYANVDAASGTLLTLIGFDNTALYTVLFGLARCLGITAQLIIEATALNDGKGVPIYRPKYLYRDEIK